MHLYGLNLLSGAVMLLFGWLLAPSFGVWGFLVVMSAVGSVVSTWLNMRWGFQCQTLSPRQFIRVALGGLA